MERWFRGNLHAHTSRSDGDLSPGEVVSWFREHGYDFVCLTDHFVVPEPGFAEAASDDGFLVIPGQELSARAGHLPVHVSALGTTLMIPEPEADTVEELLTAMVRLARTETPVVTVNHPNFFAAFTAEEMKNLPEPLLLEVYNGHPQVFNFGWPGRPSVEAMWDELLTMGKKVYAVACDDSHHYDPDGRRPESGFAAPGRGWVCVRAQALTRQEILDALFGGRFYASTGVELADIRVDQERYRLNLAPDSKPARFIFLGPGGQAFSEATGTSAQVMLRGKKGYVRAKVVGEKGRMAWTQPVFLPL